MGTNSVCRNRKIQVEALCLEVLTGLPALWRAGKPLNGYKKGIPMNLLGTPRFFAGADVRNRTADLLITNQLLYQLSYVGVY